jgi:hypothetical protein
MPTADANVNGVWPDAILARHNAVWAGHRDNRQDRNLQRIPASFVNSARDSGSMRWRTIAASVSAGLLGLNDAQIPEVTNSIPFGPALDDLRVNEATACDPFQGLIRSVASAIGPTEWPASSRPGNHDGILCGAHFLHDN